MPLVSTSFVSALRHETYESLSFDERSPPPLASPGGQAATSLQPQAPLYAQGTLAPAPTQPP
eukprot:1589698-Prymnesium_polylepis.1